ncbi:LOW QUALITY PROTEIN: signal peptidase complex subunit 1 [Gracilinanus agilis]|uniref:LOW QUALITY PROTEIN: signal peptidase complex subunit 1 n=1 Tax=Gracilinanus agilis TaxID=191870 RepID=UPI001CFD51F4|nr:LOW QUALITY PROTEIN: signal peptidase complex subunit 1 [Gracilinanus agilis]
MSCMRACLNVFNSSPPLKSTFSPTLTCGSKKVQYAQKSSHTQSVAKIIKSRDSARCALGPQLQDLLLPPPPGPSSFISSSLNPPGSPKYSVSVSLQCWWPPKAIILDGLSSLPTQMDYKGQKLAEQMFQGIILFSTVIGIIYGYVAEQFGWTVYIVMAGFAFSCLLTLLPWPIYRQHPLKWLPVQDSRSEDKKPGEKKIKRHSKNN